MEAAGPAVASGRGEGLGFRQLSKTLLRSAGREQNYYQMMKKFAKKSKAPH